MDLFFLSWEFYTQYSDFCSETFMENPRLGLYKDMNYLHMKYKINAT